MLVTHLLNIHCNSHTLFYPPNVSPSPLHHATTNTIIQQSIHHHTSVGEYTALCFAGAFSFEDGVKLTKARGEAMQAAADASSSGMVAVIGLNIDQTNEVCAAATAKTGKPIAIANYLVDGNYAVSGAKEACAAVVELAPTMGARMAVPLAVAGAFHTSFMEPAVDRLKKVLAEVEIKAPRLPVISNVDAKPHYDPDEIREILAKQVTNPVQWETIITAMVKAPEFTKVCQSSSHHITTIQYNTIRQQQPSL